MPFGMKNTVTTYQRLMNVVFSDEIRHNMEVYIDYMIVKTLEEGSRYKDLEDILE